VLFDPYATGLDRQRPLSNIDTKEKVTAWWNRWDGGEKKINNKKEAKPAMSNILMRGRKTGRLDKKMGYRDKTRRRLKQEQRRYRKASRGLSEQKEPAKNMAWGY
jgi:hypothetical protein